MVEEDEVRHDRRKHDDHYKCLSEILTTVNTIQAEVNKLNDIKGQVASMREELTEHIAEERGLFTSAFPDDDPDGHRRAHEAQIRLMEQRADFWQRMRVKAGEMTLVAFVMCLVAVLVYYWNGHMPSSAQIDLRK